MQFDGYFPALFVFVSISVFAFLSDSEYGGSSEEGCEMLPLFYTSLTILGMGVCVVINGVVLAFTREPLEDVVLAVGCPVGTLRTVVELDEVDERFVVEDDGEYVLEEDVYVSPRVTDPLDGIRTNFQVSPPPLPNRVYRCLQLIVSMY
jgi:hypothetical protein